MQLSWLRLDLRGQGHKHLASRPQGLDHWLFVVVTWFSVVVSTMRCRSRNDRQLSLSSQLRYRRCSIHSVPFDAADTTISLCTVSVRDADNGGSRSL